MTTYSMTGLYEGEQLALDFGTGSPVVRHDRQSINAKYVKGEVRIITEQARYRCRAWSGCMRMARRTCSIPISSGVTDGTDRSKAD